MQSIRHIRKQCLRHCGYQIKATAISLFPSSYILLIEIIHCAFYTGHTSTSRIYLWQIKQLIVVQPVPSRHTALLTIIVISPSVVNVVNVFLIIWLVP